MKYIKYNLSVLIKYRKELFGIAVIGVLIVHANIGALPFPANFFNKIQEYGGIGVDMFLFLSGIGLYFSLRNNFDLKRFYFKRITHVVIPYLIIAGLFYFWLYFLVDFKPIKFFYELSLLSFWVEHKGAWYVAMIIPAYILFPLLFQSMELAKSRKGMATLLVVISLGITLAINLSLPDLYRNLINVLVGIPVFILGCYYGEKVYEKKTIPVILVLVCLLLLPLKSLFYLSDNNILVGLSYSIFAIFACIIPALIIEKFSCEGIKKSLRFLGEMSLEMYLFNIYLKEVFSYYNLTNTIIEKRNDQYGIINYCLIILCGIFLSYIFHKFNNWIAGKMESHIL